MRNIDACVEIPSGRIMAMRAMVLAALEEDDEVDADAVKE